jgi:hypothetical protein
MSLEQRHGEAPDPRHDLYSLGVLWYQLLVGDVRRELHHGWSRELEAKFATPREHIELIQRCVGWVEERPRNAGELLAELQPLRAPSARADVATTPAAAPQATTSPARGQRELYRQIRLVTRMRQLERCLGTVAFRKLLLPMIVPGLLLGLAIAAGLGGLTGAATYGVLAPQNVTGANWQAAHAQDEHAAMIGFFVGVPVGLCLVGVLTWLRLRLWRKSQERAEQNLAAKVQELLDEFPQECKEWGGPSALRDREIVQEFVRNLEARR